MWLLKLLMCVEYIFTLCIKGKNSQKFMAHLKRLRVLCSSVRVLLPVRSSSCRVAGSESDSGTSFSSLQLRSTSCDTDRVQQDEQKSQTRSSRRRQQRRVWPLFRASWGSLGRQWCDWSALSACAVSCSWTQWTVSSSACCHWDLTPPAVPAYSACWGHTERILMLGHMKHQVTPMLTPG